MLPEVRAVRRAIREDLQGAFLHKNYQRNPRNVYEGYCYVATEALRHFLGDAYRPMHMTYCDGPHWFLRGPSGEVLDPTADQFEDTPPYASARGKGLLTREPSKRGQALIEAASVYLDP
jgi:hypothetical protein